MVRYVRAPSCFLQVVLVKSFAAVVSSARLRNAIQDESLTNGRRADPSEISAALHESAQIRNAFLHDEPYHGTPFQCRSHFKDIQLLAEKPFVLRDLGKLAKGGNFLVSQDGRVLVKAIDPIEADVLTSWIEKDIVSEQYGGCEHFEDSLLIPVPLTFVAKKPYIVMLNETERLQRLSGSHWNVKAPYDIKPLPNLSKGLVQILMALLDGWGKTLERLKEWLGWNKVRALLLRDLGSLKISNVVDYSFFVHVILPDGSGSPPPVELSNTNGCVQEPSGKAVICFRILDFLTEYTRLRYLESSFKGAKFDDYSGKILQAFDCFGDPTAADCKAYEEYVSLKTAANKAEVKVAFVGTSTFSNHYECKLEEPYLRYEDRDGVDFQILWGYIGNGTFPENSSYDEGSYDSSLAEYLSDQMSWESHGSDIVRGNYRDYMDLAYDWEGKYECIADSEKTFAKETMSTCKNGVHDFATLSRGLLREQRIHEDLGNVIWNPDSNSIIVVRGAPQFARWYNSHSNIVAEMLKDKCVMRARMFHCRQIPGKDAMYDYKLSFKDLELLQVFPGQYNDEEFKLLP